MHPCKLDNIYGHQASSQKVHAKLCAEEKKFISQAGRTLEISYDSIQ